ncbi:hypothetical protein HYH03_014749 [Edaphochlamys debaryana]|uniref:Uncharacterized protein n=1 Tax=Edaphochlamys debaryana TaxID=47281 RepID=A0A836BT81_9CHLO|nr:hypothetical protein HYH03_014749 [Edaphochlamys debaryana]|eukprot:KAG2486579.1 hypothetical protein HYH03_014749 [Edaphochlamys debaryana]
MSVPPETPMAAAAAAGAAPAPGEEVDWSSVDQVSQLVSRTTMAAMHQLWQNHASGMDDLGREFAERMYDSHSQAVRDIAGVKTFDVRRVLALLNAFTESCRELVLGVMQDVRRRDDDFTQQLFQTTRSAFSRNLRAALEARDAWYREKLRGLRQRHEAQLGAVRHAAAVELQQRQMQLKIALARTLAKSARAEGGFNLGALLAARTGPDAGAKAAAAPAAAGGADGGGGDPGGETMRSSAAALAAVSAASASIPDGGGAAAEVGPEAAMLEELFQDANAADALNRELEASLAKANGEVLELRDKLDAAQLSLVELQGDAGQWRSKWAIESTKTDSIKRESMAIIAKCEEHLTQLQQQHIAEISQRDYLLQRCRDTIAALEAKLAAASPPPPAQSNSQDRVGPEPQALPTAQDSKRSLA